VQEEALKAFVATTLPRSTRQVGAFIAQEFGLVYESRSGLIALLHASISNITSPMSFQSLWKGKTNLFHSDGHYANLSDLARHYIGGLLKHAWALCALCAPTTNSYRRLVPG